MLVRQVAHKVRDASNSRIQAPVSYPPTQQREPELGIPYRGSL